MIICCKHIPFKGYIAMTVWPFVIIRKEYKDKVTPVTINHESIHIRQQTELLVVPFFIIYALHYLLLRLCCYDHKTAYRNIIFEREAYAHEKDMDYLKHRHWWACFRKQ